MKQMAIFEKRIERKVTLDDTESLSCYIETAQNVNGHTEYVLKIQRGPFKETFWRILRRYNDFHTLYKFLQTSGVELQFPGKKLFGNMRPEFIAERRNALQLFINQVLMNPILASSLPAKKFLDPDSYNPSFHDQAVQNSSLCLRTDGLYTIGPTLGLIGWRLRKHYFKVNPKSIGNKNSPGQSSGSSGKHHLIKSGSQSHGKHSPSSNASTDSLPNGLHELVLTWTEYGPDKYVDDREIHNVLKSLTTVQHPHIQPIEYVASNDSGALIVRKFNQKGSLKDYLCGVQPKNPFLTKYGNPKGRSTLPLKDIAMHGRQIVEALHFLHSKGMPNGHIHAGNVIITDAGVASLLDIENFVLGVPAFYRPFFLQHSKISSAEAIDVYSFGHLLYEMSMGYPLQESVVRTITDCPDSLKHLLELILSKEACKVGLPTLDQVASHQFFKEYAPGFNEHFASATSSCKPVLKFSQAAKDQLKIAEQKTVQRLKDEQKSVKNQKRLVRVQELMSSEEEKKKIKHKVKMEQKQTRLRQQNSLQLQNGPAVIPAPLLTRSDSANSISTGQPHSSNPAFVSPPPQPSSAAAITNKNGATMFPIPPTPPVPPTSPKPSDHKPTRQSSEFLDSICNFNKTALRKVASTD